MTKSKQTKRALLSSVMALLLCFAMLLGTTFAWFTDNAATSVNKIQAGTLDVDLQDKDGNSLEGQTLSFVDKEGTKLTNILWEPGCTYDLPSVKVVNKSNLALKYKVVVTAVNGDNKLAEVLDVIYSDTDLKITEKKVGTLNQILASTDPDGFAHGNLTAGAESGEITLSLHMQETAGNTYQGKSIEGLAITVYATQDTVESDSYNNTYDKEAVLPSNDAVPVSSAAELTAAIEKGGAVALTKDIQATGVISISKDVTIYGNGNIITAAANADRIFNVEKTSDDIVLKLYNLTMEAPQAERAISFWKNSGKISVEIDSCSVTAQKYGINVAKENSNITVTVKNSSITAWAAVQTWSANSKLAFTNCTLTGVNQWNDAGNSGNDFATVVVYDVAKGAELTFENCQIAAREQGTAHQNLFDIRGISTVEADGCTFTYNGSPISAGDVSNYSANSGGGTITVK